MKAEELLKQGKQKSEAQNFLGAIENLNRAIEIKPGFVDTYHARSGIGLLLENIVTLN